MFDKKAFFLFIMCLFGCLGPIVRAIGLPSPVTAWLRAWISGAALLIYLFAIKRNTDSKELKRLIKPMALCGIFLAIDWIGLFEAYNYTTIAVATVTYYIEPVLMLIGASVFLKEKFSARHLVCIFAAFIGVALVSGIIENGVPEPAQLRGIFFAFMGALGYASLLLINRNYPDSDPILRTTIQLVVAGIVTTPYVLLRYDMSSLTFTTRGILMLILLSVGFTAVLYIFYFRLASSIPAKTVAMFSYADPVTAVIISAVFMEEKMTLWGLLGTVLVIGSAIVSEKK